MPSKKVTIAPKPQGRLADDWVNNGDRNGNPSSHHTGEVGGNDSASKETQEPSAPLKRLTIDIPEELHARIKSQCALRRTKMADEIRVLLETHFSV